LTIILLLSSRRNPISSNHRRQRQQAQQSQSQRQSQYWGYDDGGGCQMVWGREWKQILQKHTLDSHFNFFTKTTPYSHIRAQDEYEQDPFSSSSTSSTSSTSTSTSQSSPPPLLNRDREQNDNIFQKDDDDDDDDDDQDHDDYDDDPALTRVPFDPDDDQIQNNNNNQDNGGGDTNGANDQGSTTAVEDTSTTTTTTTTTNTDVQGTFTNVERFPSNPVPLHPPRGYFNYDLSTNALNGPGYPAIFRDEENGGKFRVHYQNNAWKFVLPTSDSYWREFSSAGYGPWKTSLAKRQLHINQCGNVGMQSPIDVRLSGVACVEHHQIRTLRGDFRIERSKYVDKRIESNKLRLVWQRRPCPNRLEPQCMEPDPPHADFPNGWGGFSDALHLDLKIPSEHRIYGEIFDGEMQIYHLHPGRSRLPTISVLIRSVPGRYNAYFQKMLDVFQLEYDVHKAECANGIRKNRRLVTDFHRLLYPSRIKHEDDEDDDDEEEEHTIEDPSEPYRHYHEHWADYSTLLEDPDFQQRREDHDRKLSSEIFDPYHPDLIPTYWFFGYDGSLTDPPCSEIVSWFIMDTPMIISPEQLDQMKVILFTHVNSQCQPTSTHFGESVARPIQESAGRQIWRCTREDFPPDHERGN